MEVKKGKQKKGGDRDLVASRAQRHHSRPLVGQHRILDLHHHGDDDDDYCGGEDENSDNHYHGEDNNDNNAN